MDTFKAHLPRLQAYSCREPLHKAYLSWYSCHSWTHSSIIRKTCKSPSPRNTGSDYTLHWLTPVSIWNSVYCGIKTYTRNQSNISNVLYSPMCTHSLNLDTHMCLSCLFKNCGAKKKERKPLINKNLILHVYMWNYKKVI